MGPRVSLKIPLQPKPLLNPRCYLCQWGPLEGPSAILSGHHEGLRDGKAERGGWIQEEAQCLVEELRKSQGEPWGGGGQERNTGSCVGGLQPKDRGYIGGQRET